MADPIAPPRLARVLVAATAKGGAGKSTTIACLAVFWHKAGRKVALLDADPNRTLTRWHAKGNVLSEMILRTELDEHAIVRECAAPTVKLHLSPGSLRGERGHSRMVAVTTIACAAIPMRRSAAPEVARRSRS